ncbi:MAG TPA: FecR family protein, partial [Candidatus Eisenbacteria bacterium]|nr:FecR family protein [Candidatus Eisenbacteria bacterium]
ETALDAEALLARDALRDLPPVTAEPAYRAGLKAAFTSGELAGHATAGQASARDVASTDAATERERSLLPLPFPGRHRLWTGMAVAAALVIAVTTGVLNQGPAWRVAAVRGGGSILLDGHAHSVADASLIGRRVPPGVRVEVSNGAELDLRADGVLSMQFTGGTDLILPPSPPRWFGRRTALHVQQGELRVTTGPAFPGAQLEITTPDAMIAVTGTTFAVILERTGTCVCVLEGTVGVGPRGTSPAPVSSGHLRYVFRDGRPPADSDMRDMERKKLAAFRANSMEGLERGTP